MYLQYYAMILNRAGRTSRTSLTSLTSLDSRFIIYVMTFAMKIKCYCISLRNCGIFGYHIETSDYIAIIVKTKNNAITRSKWE
jgi:hypothetical protein